MNGKWSHRSNPFRKSVNKSCYGVEAARSFSQMIDEFIGTENQRRSGSYNGSGSPKGLVRPSF